MAISDLIALSPDQYSRDLREARHTPPAIRRIEQVVQAITSNPAIASHSTARIATMIFEEAVAEVRESGMNDQFIADWIGVFGRIFEWCATGDSSALPDEVKQFLGTSKEIQLGIE